MISKYSIFRDDLLLENMINESMLYYLPPFSDVLRKLSDNEIANALLSIQSTDVKTDATFIDIDMEKEGYLTFSTIKNGMKAYADKFDFSDEYITKLKNEPNQPQIDRIYKSSKDMGFVPKSRNPVKIGRLVNTLLPKKFNSAQVEEFTNLFKSHAYGEKLDFRIVSGDDIIKWYNENQYRSGGTLGSSCMRHSRCSDYFSIYVENPDSCRMLILLEDDSLVGRALIWKIEGIEGCEYLMDRIYYSSDSYIDNFYRYASENNWAYKKYNSHSSMRNFTFNGNDINTNVVVRVKAKDYDEYPYMDTFQVYDPNEGILINDDDEDKEEHEGRYSLCSTYGEYDVITDRVYSDYYDDDFDREDCVYSSYVDSYIPRYEAIEIEDGNSNNYGIYPRDHDDVTYDDRENRWLYIEDCIFSEYYGHHILEDESVSVLSFIDDDGSLGDVDYRYDNDREMQVIDKNTNWYKIMLKQDDDLGNYEFIADDLVTEDHNDNQILDIFSLYVFDLKLENEPSGLFLSSADAELFGFKDNLIQDTNIKTDLFSYYMYIKKFNTDITLFRDKPLLTMNDIVEKLEEFPYNSVESRRLEFIKKFELE